MTKTKKAAAGSRKATVWIGLSVLLGAAIAVTVLMMSHQPDQTAAPSGKKPTAEQVAAVGVELSSGDPARVSAALSGVDPASLPADMVAQLSATPIEFDYSSLVALGYDTVQIQGTFAQQHWLFYLTLNEDTWVVVSTEQA